LPLEQNRARGVDDSPGPSLRTHQHRLEAVWDLSLGDHSTGDDQLHALLSDAATALGAEYAELYSPADQTFSAAGSPGALAVLESAKFAPDCALGRVVAEIAQLLLVRDTEQEPVWGAHPLVTAVPLRSILATPLEHSGKRHILLLAWNQRRDSHLTDEETRYIGFFARIVTRLLENLDREREISTRIVTDHLTGLYNRAAMTEQIAIAVSSAGRSGGSLALLYVDLDGFKEVNDNYGHALGDAALQEAAARMRSVLRKHEAAGRIGGDEFALLVTSFADEQQLAQIAKRVLAALRSPIGPKTARTRLTASIGIAIYPQHGKTPEELMEHADRAMYQAKRRAGDGYVIYGASEEAKPAVRHLFAAQLADAVMQREFFLCFQPIVHARTGRVMAAEALIRWLHPGMGMLAPHAFLDDSRNHQVVNRIHGWVLQSTLEKQLRLRAIGRRLLMHVNVSEPDSDLLQLSHESLPDLRFEISENAVAEDEKAFVRFIAAARERGVRTGLSNFGAGRLSLAVLAELPLDFVKVTPDASAAVIDTAHRFGWNVIAENVETVRQRETLSALGVEGLQGYQICSPLAESDFDSWLEYQGR